MIIVERNPHELIEAEYNPRELTADQFEQIKASLTRFGFVDPVIVNKHEARNDIIVGGHQRIKVARELGIDTVPTVEVSLDADKERELNVRLNKNTGGWDWDVLANEFDVGDLLEWGFTEDDLQAFDVDLPAEPEEVEATEPPDDPITEPGRIYQLGKHRLMCGDSTDSEQVGRLMDGEKADICFTSPPYGVGSMEIDGNESTQKKYESFEDSGYDWYEFVKKVLIECLKVSDEVFYNIGMVQANKVDLMRLPVTMSENFKDIIYWVKDTCAPHIQGGVINNRCEFILCFGDNKRKFKNAQFSQGSYFNVIEGGNASGNEYAKIHKATFPIYLPTNIIENFSPKNGVVYDCFGGTGTTLIACEQLKRTCYMMELDPAYCDVIVKRYAETVGANADEIFETGFHA